MTHQNTHPTSNTTTALTSGEAITRRNFALMGASAALALANAPAFASTDYPSKPIRMIVPFPPGGATDVVARMVAKSMSEQLGQPVVIDNRGGAGAIIGAEAAAKSDPDGYTVLYTTAGVHVVNPAIYAKLPYDPIKSWSMITQLVTAPLVLAVTTKSPFKTAKELIDYAKKNPGKLTYGSAGNGTSLHQTGEMFKHATGAHILHIPYRGAGPAMNDFLGGQVDMMFSYVGSIQPGVKSGKLRMLALGSPKRLPLLPDLPTIGEVVNQPGFNSDTWTGLVAPTGVPASIVERLRVAAHHALDQNRDYLVNNGYMVLGGSPKQMTEQIEQELKDLTPLLAKLMTKS